MSTNSSTSADRTTHRTAAGRAVALAAALPAHGMAMSETVVIADYDYGDVAVEREIIESAGFTLRALQCTSEDELVAGARDAVTVVTQYARVGARAIAELP